jgi:hypothetical protein
MADQKFRMPDLDADQSADGTVSRRNDSSVAHRTLQPNFVHFISFTKHADVKDVPRLAGCIARPIPGAHPLDNL